VKPAVEPRAVASTETDMRQFAFALRRAQYRARSEAASSAEAANDTPLRLDVARAAALSR